MIVEFIGCSGAGKTTLIAAIRQSLSQRATVVSSFEVVADRLGLSHITHPTLQNLIQEMAGLPFFLVSIFKYQAFLRFALRMMARHGKFNFFTFNYLRSLERTLGVHGFIRQTEHTHGTDPQIVFVDEGTIVPAHNIFVYNDAHYSAEEIARYAELAPLPDVIVYVRAPVDSLIKRTLQRSDPPREMRGQSQAKIEYYVRRADEMFEQLVNAESMQDRVLRVDNPEADGAEYKIVAEGIADTLLRLANTEKGVKSFAEVL